MFRLIMNQMKTTGLVLYINATRCRGKYRYIISQYPDATYIVIYNEQSGRVRIIGLSSASKRLSFIIEGAKVKCKRLFKKYPKAKRIYDTVCIQETCNIKLK